MGIVCDKQYESCKGINAAAYHVQTYHTWFVDSPLS